MEKLLTYDSVEISYGGEPVVRGVSFSLAPGEILGIVGESGSGKSTLIRGALGLLGSGGMVTRGDIWFQGNNLPDLPEKEMRKIRGARIGMIFQDAGASLCPVRTIGAQIRESLSAHRKISRRESDGEALELLDKLGFRDGKRILESYPFELSGGMNQRVGIAIACLPKPGVLLADEPTSALDVTVQKQAVEEMLLMRRLYGTAMILVTHNIGVVRAMADSVLVLKEGEMVEYGPAPQVLAHPRADYTKKLLAAVPELRRE
ncbi:MAG TPA: ABC transporter ATP-binding protein [Candidatus Scatomonas pullistercoris]|uniref:ABC transporter ATP-binding protein n=1 Tax=Candidatus Scatomonas pullistercoris TaxID=2840920 RepID=A0A9D1P263_9FIRM|nr:ABC transporter ATP-binding protein [Candidatus Scatomonas pullistercoris]